MVTLKGVRAIATGRRDSDLDGSEPSAAGSRRTGGGTDSGTPGSADMGRFVANVVVPNEARLGRLATAILGDQSWAEDVVADVLVAYWRRSQRTAIANPEAYLYRAVANRAKWYRRRRALLLLTPSPPDLPGDEDVEGRLIDRQVCVAALAQLSTADRTVLVLRYLEDRTDEAIADLLSLPVGTVKSRLARSRRRLHAKLSEQEDT